MPPNQEKIKNREALQDLEKKRQQRGKFHKVSRGRQAKGSKAAKEELQAEQRAKRRQERSSQRVRSYHRQEKKQSSSLCVFRVRWYLSFCNLLCHSQACEK